MPSLKEIKGRIGSVKSTLKITSAMKLVSSAKLRKAQQAIGSMLPYQEALQSMLSTLVAGRGISGEFTRERDEIHSVAIVAVASNSSLCGGFNANAVRKVMEALREYEKKGITVTVYSIGRKMAESMRKIGKDNPDMPKDHVALSGSPAYDGAAALASSLIQYYLEGKFDRIELIYNHFVSTGTQSVTREAWIPISVESDTQEFPAPEAISDREVAGYIVEPSVHELIEELLPKTLRLKIYTVLLDSAAAEHAARTVAMQTATDNGEDLLDELTLEYNKGRQQKITSEILDLVGGTMK